MMNVHVVHFSYLHTADEIVVIAQSSKGIAFGGGVDWVLHLVYPWPIYFKLNDHLVRNSAFIIYLEIYLVLTLLGGAGLLHGSSRSHWLRKKTSSSPMKSMKDGPPHVEARVGPADAINGQLQLIWNRKRRCFTAWVMTRRESALSTPREARLRTTTYFDRIRLRPSVLV